MELRDDADERARTVLRVFLRGFLGKNPAAAEEQAVKWLAETIQNTKKGREPRTAAEVLMAFHLNREIRGLIALEFPKPRN